MALATEDQLPSVLGELLVVDDQLPFRLTGPKSIIFQTSLALPQIDNYLFMAKAKADALAAKLSLNEQQRQDFISEFQESMDRLAAYAMLVNSEKDRDLHPTVRVVTKLFLDELETRRPDPPSLFLP